MVTLKLKLFCTWFVLAAALLTAQAQQGAAPQPQGKPSPTGSGEDATKKSVAQQPAKPFTTQLKKTVAFLTTYCHDGDQIVKVQGTGFFVAVPDKRLGEGGFVYLVTNRHVAEALRQDGSKRQVVSSTVRLNLKQETAGRSRKKEL